MQKIPFWTKFLATVCFFTLIFPNSTHFCACFRITSLKIELSAQSASLHTNFCNNSEYSFIRKIIEKKSYFSCSSSLNVTVDGGLNPQWEGNNDWKRELGYRMNEKKSLVEVSASQGNAWSQSSVRVCVCACVCVIIPRLCGAANSLISAARLCVWKLWESEIVSSVNRV